MSALPDEYRAAMRNLATGVVVISTRSPEGHPLATTLSAVTSVSLAPPLLLACLGRDSETLRGIKSSGGFVINVLGKDQEETSTRLAQKGGPGKLKDIELASTSNGAPCLATGPAWMHAG